MYRNGMDFSRKSVAPPPVLPRKLSEYELYLETLDLTGRDFNNASDAFHAVCWSNMGREE